MNQTHQTMQSALEALEGLINRTSAQAIYSFMETERRIAISACVGLRETLAEQPAPMIRGDIRDGLVDDEPAHQHIEHCLWARNGNQPCPHVQPAQQQKEGFASPGGGYVPAIPRPMPLDWKLVPRKATPEMLKAMDECAQEGYGERLYAGMASSVYMAAWDASPVMGTLPEQPAQQQEPVAYSYTSRITGAQGFSHHPMPRFIDSESWDIQPLYTSPPPAQRKPLTDEQLADFLGDEYHAMTAEEERYFRLAEAAHGIKEQP